MFLHALGETLAVVCVRVLLHTRGLHLSLLHHVHSGVVGVEQLRPMRSARTGIDTPGELQHGVAAQGLTRVVDKGEITQSDATHPSAGQDEQCLLHGVEGEWSMRRDKRLLLTGHGGP